MASIGYQSDGFEYCRRI